ncbi:MAG: hypothetical protein C5S38_08655 [Candidatus Methanophagaceae archaeon]|jgi:hypothetical protein|nr:MAG: hypothetical protein C5S38_08655 [Methanophagales archaeon]KAF5436436.1 hypothetical protein C5S36_00295 [Methanophagales archaeon]
MVSNTNNNGMDKNVNAGDEKLLIHPLNDENSRKITQIISNDTARNILEAIASELAEKLGISKIFFLLF